MVTIIKIRTARDLVRASNSLKGMHTKLPEMNSKAMMKWGKILEKDMKVSAREADIKPSTGLLFGKGIEYRQRPKGKTGALFVAISGVRLDGMKPHFVNITRSRSRLLRWASTSKNFRDEARLISSGKLKKHTIFVRPHPFIRNGWRRARPKLKPILQQEVRKLVENIK